MRVYRLCHRSLVVLCAIVLCAPIVFSPRSALAEVYDVSILATDEHELLELLEQGDIDQEEYDRLLHMLERPLDLNRARRERLFDLPGLTWPMADEIIRYRTEVELLRDVQDLEDVGIPRDVIRQLEPFARVAKRLLRPPAVTGSATMRTLEIFEDGASPSSYFRLRTEILGELEVGLVGLLQDRSGTFEHVSDPNGGLPWLTVKPEELVFRLPFFYVYIDQPNWSFIIGSYQVGFGRRLVFDNSSRDFPNGIYPDDVVLDDIESGKHRVDERMYGIAGSVRGLSFGEGAGEMEATFFASMWPYDIYFDAIDSAVADAADCKESSPLICVPGVSRSECAASGNSNFRPGYQTLRSAYWELILGANVGYLPAPDWRIGVTGYWAKLSFMKGEGDLEFAPSGPYPNRPSFGAVGFDFHGQIDFATLFGEYAYTFEAGHAAFLAGVLGWKQLDVEISGRYFAEDFDNPHARGPDAQDDEFEGQRDRDEAGARVRVNYRPLGWLRTRLDVDVWYRMSLDYAALELSGRIELDALEWLTISTGLEYRDKVLTQGGRDEEWADDAMTTSAPGYVAPTEPSCIVPKDVGRGATLKLWGQVRVDPGPRLRLLVFFKSSLYDKTVSTEPFYDTNFAHDFYVYLKATWKILDELLVAARVKFYDEEIDFDARGASYVDAWLQIRWQIIHEVAVQVRYGVRVTVDDKLYREQLWARPFLNPQHLLRASIDVLF